METYIAALGVSEGVGDIKGVTWSKTYLRERSVVFHWSSAVARLWAKFRPQTANEACWACKNCGENGVLVVISCGRSTDRQPTLG